MSGKGNLYMFNTDMIFFSFFNIFDPWLAESMNAEGQLFIKIYSGRIVNKVRLKTLMFEC